jgi:hypothetical protein
MQAPMRDRRFPPPTDFARVPKASVTVAIGRRCRNHGGLSTGPRTPMGKLRCAGNMRRVRVNGAPPGHKKTDKARRRREARLLCINALAAREDRKQVRRAKWERRKRIETGLPLVDNQILQEFGADE